MCPDCGKAQTDCSCKTGKAKPAFGDGFVRVGRESKGRGGKTVTLVTGVAVAPAQLGELCTRLKKLCGSGGAVKDGVVEIQGDHRDTVAAELTKQGWKVKRVGG